VDFERMNGAQRTAYYEALGSALEEVLVSLGPRLPERDQEITREYLDAGEYGLAPEQIADGLTEVADPERSKLIHLAETVDSERTINALATCPRPGDGGEAC
jgi:hypothetical protein